MQLDTILHKLQSPRFLGRGDSSLNSPATAANTRALRRPRCGIRANICRWAVFPSSSAQRSCSCRGRGEREREMSAPLGFGRVTFRASHLGPTLPCRQMGGMICLLGSSPVCKFSVRRPLREERHVSFRFYFLAFEQESVIFFGSCDDSHFVSV